MTRMQVIMRVILAHGVALALILSGLALWQAHGMKIMLQGVFALC